jgi:hypothetical protein
MKKLDGIAGHLEGPRNADRQPVLYETAHPRRGHGGAAERAASECRTGAESAVHPLGGVRPSTQVLDRV